MILLDAACQQLHEVRHILVRIRQRASVRHREVQQTSDFACHVLCGPDDRACRRTNTGRHLGADVTAPAVCRRSNGAERVEVALDAGHTGRDRGAQIGHGTGHHRLHAGEGRASRGLHAVPARRNRRLHCVHSRRCRAADGVPAGTEYRLDARPTAAGQAAEVVPSRRDGTLDRID